MLHVDLKPSAVSVEEFNCMPGGRCLPQYFSWSSCSWSFAFLVVSVRFTVPCWIPFDRSQLVLFDVIDIAAL
ncbi:hypothetical protein ECG_04983 [Echinococcus granulosus]|uniref:Uncharacterized protein n=1 Tax=Echinococcus granulosus TaxID=6210 RepID=U6FU43_ECHGR|nr:hypothetical protein ECG_04983 [Echinococcus granulosus]CDI70207.1 hypothetical protein EgrG_002068500 [Echinococcus granulosus]